MFAHTKYGKIDLPEYPQDKVIWKKSELAKISEADAKTVIRAVRTAQLDRLSLHDILSLADKEFASVSTLVGAEVVGHQWGLARMPLRTPQAPHRQYPSSASSTLPPNYCLVAEVDVVHDIEPLSDSQSDDVMRTSIEYFESAGQYKWRELYPAQFRQGRTLSQEATKLLLLDIEPILDRYCFC